MKEVQKGYIRIGVLILLSRKAAHGYELMKEIRSRTKGFWSPTAGGVYPILRNLEKSGYIQGEWQTYRNRKLKVYKITESGSAILKDAIIKQAEISNTIGALFFEFARNVLNIELEKTGAPNLPSFFSSFLEENAAKHRESLKELQTARKQISENMKMMQKKMKYIEKQIAETKKAKKERKPVNPA
jgi:DNA-binding PadR family transcriptional regulator